eukprot:scaffold990_cov393-Prasinococcus_capsulatus_cf.AAC.3
MIVFDVHSHAVLPIDMLRPGKPLPLDTSKVGTFILEYNVADLAGNDAEPVTRIVQVVPSLDVSPGATCESP